MQLSPEILGFVVESFDKWDCMECRLVCKSFDQAVVPHLFDRLYPSDKRAHLKIAELVVQRFGRHIRTLKFSSTHYEDPNSESFQDSMRKRNEDQSKYRSIDCFTQHEEYAWKRYIERRAERQDLNESGELLHVYALF